MKLVEAERPQDEICFQKMIILTFEVIVQPTHNFYCTIFLFSANCVASQWVRKLKIVQAKKLVRSNKSKFFLREIPFLAVLNFFPSSKIDFWPFLKLQKMEFGQKRFVKFFYVTFFNWTF